MLVIQDYDNIGTCSLCGFQDIKGYLLDKLHTFFVTTFH